jgi:hypothetical protein
MQSHSCTGILLGLCCCFVWGCHGSLGQGRGAEYRSEYDALRDAVLTAQDAAGEAEALRNLGDWLAGSPYAAVVTEHGSDGLEFDPAQLQPGARVDVALMAKSDWEPRRGGFVFVPKDPMNLLLLLPERNRASSR